MDWSLHERLAQAERHVAEGAERIRRQRETVESLAHAGESSAVEQRVLRQLEHVHALDLADLHRLQAQVRTSSWQPATPMFLGSQQPTLG